MRKSIIWKLVVIILVTGASLFLALDIRHPDWTKSLVFWQPEYRRDIVLHYGLDLGGGLEALLAVDAPEGEEPDAETLETARRIAENRATSLALTEATAQVVDKRHILVQVPYIQETQLVTSTLEALGQVEIINAGTLQTDQEIMFLLGNTVETTLSNSSVEEPAILPTAIPTPAATPTLSATPTIAATPAVSATPAATVTPTAPVTVTPTAPVTATPTAPVTPTTPPPTTPTGPVYETVASNEGLEFVEVQPDAGPTGYIIRFRATRDAATLLNIHAMTRRGEYLCITLDKLVITCFPADPSAIPFANSEGVPQTLPLRAYIPGYFLAGTPQHISTVIPHGALPVPLKVEEFKTAEPALGKSTVEGGKVVVIIAFIATLLLLPAHYRLSGLLADLALLLFALIALALCKVIPVPLTLASVTGLAVTALLTLGGLLSAFERLREEIRAWQTLPKAVENGFSRAWPSVRDAHLTLLILSIPAWYLGARSGASAVHWMGVALTVGTLTGLFITMFVTRALAYLVFDAAQEWLSERAWTLGIQS